MSISVAMCTYNGARYLREQLESIAAQSRLPRELVICDDRSADDTPRIVRDFAAGAPFRVSLHVNKRNLGSTKNFERAIGLCGGDVIALCDQDDVWLPHKLARLEAALAAAPDVGLVFSDAEVVDERLRPLGYRLWHSTFSRRERLLMEQGRSFESLLRRNFVTGATAAFRSELRRFFMPIPDLYGRIHDGWIALIASAISRIAFVDEALILYRQHPQQQIGAAPQPRPRSEASHAYVLRDNAKGCSYEVSEIERLCGVLSRFATQHPELAGSLVVAERRADYLRGEIKHLRRRAEIVSSKSKLGRLPAILEEFAARRYHAYSKGAYSAVKDLLNVDSYAER